MYANKNVCARFVISYSFFVFVITSQHQGRVMRINLTKIPKINVKSTRVKILPSTSMPISLLNVDTKIASKLLQKE